MFPDHFQIISSTLLWSPNFNKIHPLLFELSC